jgi:hypothetical protein
MSFSDPESMFRQAPTRQPALGSSRVPIVTVRFIINENIFAEEHSLDRIAAGLE